MCLIARHEEEHGMQLIIWQNCCAEMRWRCMLPQQAADAMQTPAQTLQLWLHQDLRVKQGQKQRALPCPSGTAMMETLGISASE